MQKQNIMEYRLVRREIENIKKCITDYLGFLFSAMGIIFAAWGGIGALSSNINYTSIAYSALALSLIVIFILFILVYKFISHNRLAGYCMLLNQEVWEKDNWKQNHLLSWEWCLELLREADFKREIKDKVGISLSNEEEAISKSYNIKISKPESSPFKGIVLFAKAFLRLQKTSSWGFPLAVIRIFFTLVFGLLIFAFYLLQLKIDDFFGSWIHLIVFSLVLIIQLILWSNIFSRFHSLMCGDSTVKNFCDRFIPIRRTVLNEYGVEGAWKLCGKR